MWSSRVGPLSRRARAGLLPLGTARKCDTVLVFLAHPGLTGLGADPKHNKFILMYTISGAKSKHDLSIFNHYLSKI